MYYTVKRPWAYACLALVMSIAGCTGVTKAVKGKERPSLEQHGTEQVKPESDPVLPKPPFDPKAYLYESSKDHAQVLDRIIRCESGWNVSIKNKNSSASGLAQFINGTWIETRSRMNKPDPDLKLKHDAKEHIDTMIFLWNNGMGAGHWKESKKCWSNSKT